MSVSAEGINPAQLRCCGLWIKRIPSLDHWLHLGVVAWNQQQTAAVRPGVPYLCQSKVWDPAAAGAPAARPWQIHVCTPDPPVAGRKMSLTPVKIVLTGKSGACVCPGAAGVPGGGLTVTAGSLAVVLNHGRTHCMVYTGPKSNFADDFPAGLVAERAVSEVP